LFFLSTVNFSQNKQLLYGFAENPQTLLLNPGAETNYKFHIGVPLLSGFSANLGLKNLSLSDLFLDDGIDINTKVFTLLNTLDVKDHIKINTQIDVLNGGFRFDDKTYFSFGFYQELDAIGYFPTDVLTLLNEGNASYLNRSFDLSQLVYKVDFIGTLHFGVSRKINSKLTVGGRFKIYSSTVNYETNNNSGTFTTQLGTNNIYTHYLNDLNLNFKSSGTIEDNEYIENPSDIITDSFLGGNLGVGFDFGVTYHLSPKLEFTGSIIDVGFINHSKRVQNNTVIGSYTFEGINFLYDSTDPSNYWEELDQDFNANVPKETNTASYVSWRPTKINVALKYSFGNERRSKYCYDSTFKEFYSNAFGVQVHSIFRPLSSQIALTSFYERIFTEKLHAKVTYTLDDYSLYNLGFGVSAQLGNVAIFGMIDNILEMQNLANANSMSIQMGINLIFD
jgi:hypothetical protein